MYLPIGDPEYGRHGTKRTEGGAVFPMSTTNGTAMYPWLLTKVEFLLSKFCLVVLLWAVSSIGVGKICSPKNKSCEIKNMMVSKYKIIL